LVEVDSLTRTTLEATVKSELERRGYHSDAVWVRDFDSSRIPLALQTGTDRDQTSTDWQWPKFDNVTRPKLADPSTITYAAPLTVGPTHGAGVDKLWWDGGEIEARGKGIEVYDLHRLKLAPGSIAEYE